VTQTPTASRKLKRAPERVSPEQVEAYEDSGWALVRNAVPAALAKSLYERINLVGDAFVPQSEELPVGQQYVGQGLHRAQHLTFDRPERDEDIRSVIFSPYVVGLAKDFLRVDEVRHVRSVVLKKEPERDGGAATSLHQDLCYLPFDRTGSVTVWVALTEITPEMGSLVFVPGSPRFGPLGRDAFVAPENDRVAARDAEEHWPLTEAHHLQPGDATIHADLTIHGAPPNQTESDRWAIAMTFMRPDVLYTGAPWRHVADLGIEPNQPFDHERFPLLS
jgi:ectoine hydroxylase-related dioxygenase (phytanoyl-CoA dioxygenase family)